MDLMLMHFSRGDLTDRRLSDIHSLLASVGFDLGPTVPLATATELEARRGREVWRVRLSETDAWPVDCGGAMVTIEPRGLDGGALFAFCRLARYVIQRVSYVIVVDSELDRDLPEYFGQVLVHVSSPEELLEALQRD